MKSNTFKATTNFTLQNVPTKLEIKNAKKKLEKARKKLSELQDAMYAEGKFAVLICIQGMDTSGKDSLIREVFKDVNARGVLVHSFKVPTELELKHDFLWRHYIALPAKGKMGIFNRSHYENVLVTRVHPSYILKEDIPQIKTVEDVNDAFFHDRMKRINDFEYHLAKNGTIIFKFFLNLSKDEQKNRLLRRLELPHKNWKFSKDDIKERKLWDQYMHCYQDMLQKTSTKSAPWFVIPADDKDVARIILANILVKELQKYNFTEPQLPDEIKVHVQEYKAQLHNE